MQKSPVKGLLTQLWDVDLCLEYKTPNILKIARIFFNNAT